MHRKVITVDSEQPKRGRAKGLHVPKHRRISHLNGKMPVSLRNEDSYDFAFPVRVFKRNGVLFVEPLEEEGESPSELRCPSCGYTEADCRLHRDHHLCGSFPFFPNEVA